MDFQPMGLCTKMPVSRIPIFFTISLRDISLILDIFFAFFNYTFILYSIRIHIHWVSTIPFTDTTSGVDNYL